MKLSASAAPLPPPPSPPHSTTGMLFYNSMLSLPLLLLAVVLKGEPSSMTSYPLLWSPQVGGGCCRGPACSAAGLASPP